MPRGTYKLDVDKILQLAFRKGWSETQLLKKAGLSLLVIYRAKNGGRTYPNTVYVLAVTLGVEPEEIIIKEN
jgi:lambda repressor-like predicted transcriptional regulator